MEDAGAGLGWRDSPWADYARGRTGIPRLAHNRSGGSGDRAARTAAQSALADAAIALWRDLWAKAYGPCPRCGHRRPVKSSP